MPARNQTTTPHPSSLNGSGDTPSVALDLDKDDPEKVEHVVRVTWVRTVPENEAYWEKGMFANQNSACHLRQSFTLEKVIKHFDLPEYEGS